jgi:hypothetical protein
VAASGVRQRPLPIAEIDGEELSSCASPDDIKAISILVPLKGATMVEIEATTGFFGSIAGNL